MKLWAWLMMALLALAGCAQGPRLRGKIEGLNKLTDRAEQSGALRCAPRELALARANLRFAEIELDQGFISKAKNHLWVAEPNAHAAVFLSPAEHCTEKEAPKPAPGDRDGDGYPDTVDQCPDKPENYNGTDDHDGCPEDPDTDGDGIADSTDSCPLAAEDKDNYLDEDGCPDVDNDLDTVADATDKCPNDPEDPDGYEDEDGCPELDNDKDEVPDLKDQCPNEIGSKTKKPLGCPTKPALVVVTDCEVKITQQIHFAFNKAVIRRASYPVLDAVVDVLNKMPTIKIEVQGHTDNKGSARYNKRLSDRRAASVMKYLTSKGISADRLASKGYGFDRPLVPNTSKRNRALNRRVQFVRTEGSKPGCPPTSKK